MYVGETSRHSFARIVDNKQISIIAGQTLTVPFSSNICDHAVQKGQDNYYLFRFFLEL